MLDDMNKSILFIAMLVPLIALHSGCASPRQVQQNLARPFPVVGVPKGATREHRAAADRLAKEFRLPVVTFEGNPVCCVWLELNSWHPSPGTDGYVIVHQTGGTTITASSPKELEAAVTRFIKSARVPQGQRVVPVGLMTSYEVLK
jgi:hypothetical protein